MIATVQIITYGVGSGVELLCEVREAHQDYGFNRQAFQTLQQKLNHANWVYCKASALHFGRMITDSSDSIEEELNQLGKAIEETIRDLIPKLAHLRHADTYVGAFASALQGMSEVSYDEKLIALSSARIAVTVEAITGRCGDELPADHKLNLQKHLNLPKDMDFRTSRRYPALNEQKMWLSVHVKRWLQEPSKPVLWLQGQGGMGKSHFCSSLAKELYVEGQLVACLGFRFNDPQKNNPMTLIKSLLCYNLPDVINPEDPGVVAYFFECLIKKHELLAVLNSKTYNEEELWKALVLMFDGLKAALDKEFKSLSKDVNSNLELRKPMLLIVDAVNEVEGSYRNLLEPFLCEIAGYLECMPNIKMLVTSTATPVDRNLKKYCDSISLDDNIENRGDVELFLRDCWKCIVPNEKELIDKIYEKSKGRFIVLKIMENSLTKLPSQLTQTELRLVDHHLDFNWNPYVNYIDKISKDHHPILAIMIAVKVPIALAHVAALLKVRTDNIILKREEFDRLFFLDEDEYRSEKVASKFYVYHESVFIYFDKLRDSNAYSLLTESTRLLIEAILQAEINITKCFDDIYNCLVRRTIVIPIDYELEMLFHLEYISFFLGQKDEPRVSRCITLEWMAWRLLKETGSQPNKRFAALIDDYYQVAVFDLFNDKSLITSCKVMLNILKILITDSKSLDNSDEILGNSYIEKLKSEGKKYLREHGGWMITNPILHPLKLLSHDEKLIPTNPQFIRCSIGTFEFGPAEERLLVSFKYSIIFFQEDLFVEVFELSSRRKLFEDLLSTGINIIRRITQFDENLFAIWY
eukprot:gene15192-16962_t